MPAFEIKHLPQKQTAKEITSDQGVLDLRIEAEKEIQGVGMGVLNDGMDLGWAGSPRLYLRPGWL